MITNFDYKPPGSMKDIGQRLKDVILRISEWPKIEQERKQSPNWEWQPVYVCSNEIAELYLANDTPTSVKMMLLAASYVGHQWVEINVDD